MQIYLASLNRQASLRNSFVLLFILASGILSQAYESPNVPQQAHQIPSELENVGLTDHSGKKINADIQFIDDQGRQVQLNDYLNQGKPILLSMVYFSCPSLCNYHLTGLTDVFKKMKWQAGKDFTFLAVSMNHREGPTDALAFKEKYLKTLGRPDVASGWHFLTGNEAAVQTLTQQLGFQFKWLEGRKEYSHASVAYVLSPNGSISRQIYGIEFNPQTFGFSLVEAGQGKVGTIVDQFMLFCFQFDPSKNKYTLYAYNLMRVAAAMVAIVLAIVLIPLWMKERHQPPGPPLKGVN